MSDPDRPHIEMTPELADAQEACKTLAALAAFYYLQLKDWSLPDSLVNELVANWQDHSLGACDD